MNATSHMEDDRDQRALKYSHNPYRTHLTDAFAGEGWLEPRGGGVGGEGWLQPRAE